MHLSSVEGCATLVIKLPRDTLASKTGKRNSNNRVVPIELLIKVSKPKERLNILNLARFGLVYDNLDFS
jgi:hypothetical protein